MPKLPLIIKSSGSICLKQKKEIQHRTFLVDLQKLRSN